MVSSVLMSIRPMYVEAILDGTKTVELRRRRPSFPAGTTVLIYATSPDKKVQGAFEVGGVLEGAPPDIWERVKDRAGLDRSTFDQYFAGSEMAYAIEVVRPRRTVPTPIAIRPPQSYQFLNPRHRRHKAVLSLAVA